MLLIKISGNFASFDTERIRKMFIDDVFYLFCPKIFKVETQYPLVVTTALLNYRAARAALFSAVCSLGKDCCLGLIREGLQCLKA